jgi:hypothetical protein
MEMNLTFEIWVAVAVFLLIVSILGNSLTFASIIVPKRRNKHGFDDSEWLSSTVFVLNLALSDILFCLFQLCALVYGLLVYLEHVVHDSSKFCKFMVIGLQDFGLVNGWSIALIAITQALPRIK